MIDRYIIIILINPFKKDSIITIIIIVKIHRSIFCNRISNNCWTSMMNIDSNSTTITLIFGEITRLVVHYPAVFDGSLRLVSDFKTIVTITPFIHLSIMHHIAVINNNFICTVSSTANIKTFIIPRDIRIFDYYI